MEKDKPHGYVAWHPDRGYEAITFVCASAGADSAMALLVDEDCAGFDFSDASDPDCDYDKQIERAKEAGWEIRPVKLTFLDED